MSEVLAKCEDLEIRYDRESGGITQINLYGKDLLADADPALGEIAVNDVPLRVRSEAAERRRELGDAASSLSLKDLSPKKPGGMYAEHFINQYCGYGFEITRHLRVQPHKNMVAMRYQLRRTPAKPTCPVPGPGGPPIEARLHVDTFSTPRWQWRMWGDNTRMIHLSLHANGPDGEYSHVGYNRGTVDEVRGYLRNIWRRQYPGVMAVHGAVYYDEDSGNWLAFTCRLPKIGYYVDLEHAGLGLSYNFTLHGEVKMGRNITLPEITIYYGETTGEMEQFIKDYTTERWHPAPEWNGNVAWLGFNLWSPHTSWGEMWGRGQRLIDNGVCSAIGPYNMVHNWSRAMGGTTPMGYEPDPTMGSVADFEKGALAVKERGVPLGIWMSHSGLAPGRDIDEDWFIRGVDDNYTASWGSQRGPALVCINPGHPGYIEYTKKWLKYYIELGFRWFFFDCGGWAMPPDFRERDFMDWPGDTGVMAVRFYEEITPYAQSLDPGVIISGEGFSSDFPVHVPALSHNPVHSPDGLGPRDYVLSWNRLPGRHVVVDQAGSLVPASGTLTLPWNHIEGDDFDDKWEKIYSCELFQKVTAFVKEHSIYNAVHVPGDISVLDGHAFFPGHYKGDPVKLPEAYAKYSKVTDVTSGESYTADSDGAFSVPGVGMYELQ